MADHFVSLQLIGLTRAPSVKMKNERETVGIAQIAAQRDVLIIDDDIPRLPRLRVFGAWIKRKRMTVEEHPKIAHPAKIDVGIRRLYAIRLRIGRDVFIDHILQRIPCMRKGMPDDIGADAMFKATMVDGVYDKDPHKYPDAVKYDTLTFTRVLDERLAVMDSTAATLCRDNGLPIVVFDLNEPANIARALQGENVGTIVRE